MPDAGLMLQGLVNIDHALRGFIAAAVVDIESGVPLISHAADESFDLGVASSNNSEIVKAKLNTIEKLQLSGLEDMSMTLTTQLHVIVLVGRRHFLYVACGRRHTNVSLVRAAVAGQMPALRAGLAED